MTRIVASIESTDGSVATISVSGRVVTLEIPGSDPIPTVTALRAGPAHARRFAEALLLAARIAEATST